MFGRRKRKQDRDQAAEDRTVEDPAGADGSAVGEDADAAATPNTAVSSASSRGSAADGSGNTDGSGGHADERAAAGADADGQVSDEPDEPDEPQDRSDGPFDESEVDELDELAAESRVLDLGSVLVPVPEGGQVQVELAGNGSVNGVFVTIGGGRVTMSAFAAPKSPGQWRSVIGELADSVRGDGAKASVREGPWGRELHAASGNGDVRFIGVDGPRWMLRGVAIGQKGTVEDEAELTQIAREMVSGTVVRRGDDPMPVRAPLNVTLPTALAEQLAQTQQQQQAQNQSRQQQESLQQLRERQQQMSDGLRQTGGNLPGSSSQGPTPGASSEASEAGGGRPRQNPDGSAMQQLRNGSAGTEGSAGGSAGSGH